MSRTQIENDMQAPPEAYEQERFHLTARHPFPSMPNPSISPPQSSLAQQYIFSQTGYSAKPMNLREWHLFNQSLNQGFRMGLDDHTLQVLSMLDHALADVKRFEGVLHMHEIASDSTAAHSKQTMHNIQQIFCQAFPSANRSTRPLTRGVAVDGLSDLRLRETPLPDEIQSEMGRTIHRSCRRDALLRRDNLHGCPSHDNF